MDVLRFRSFDQGSGNQQVFDVEAKQPAWVIPKDSDNSNYLQDYLKSIIGRFVNVDFLIGNDSLISKEGILKEVGTDYIVLEMVQSNELLLCDIYSVKFVQII